MSQDEFEVISKYKDVNRYRICDLLWILIIHESIGKLGTAEALVFSDDLDPVSRQIVIEEDYQIW